MGWLDNQGIMLQFLELLQFVNIGSGNSPSLLFNERQGFFLPRVKQQWREADHSPLPRAKNKNEGCYNSTLPHASMQCMGLTLPLPLCCTHFISSMVALFIGSICNIWHSMLTTDLFRYSGMGKTPAIKTVNRCHFLTETTKTPKTECNPYGLLLLYVGQLHKFFSLSGSYEIQSGSNMYFIKLRFWTKQLLLPLKFIIMVKMTL